MRGDLVRGDAPGVVCPVADGRAESFEFRLHLIDPPLLCHQRIIELPDGVVLEGQVRFEGIDPRAIGRHIIPLRSSPLPA